MRAKDRGKIQKMDTTDEQMQKFKKCNLPYKSHQIVWSIDDIAITLNNMRRLKQVICRIIKRALKRNKKKRKVIITG